MLAAGVAHEINNPLGVILGYTRLLRRTSKGGALDDLSVIEDEVLRCQEIVQGLLELSRPVPQASERISLRPLADDVVRRLREAHRADGAAIHVEGEAEAVGNADKLRQVVLNLVQNAVEAAGPQGEVDVTLRTVGAQAELAVGDSGPGLTEEARTKLFEPFYTTKPRGTGLGLAISQSIARAHRGSIAVSTSSRGGALFTLRVPRTAPEHARS
jgi:signal transduction histidine kinase